MSPDDIRALYDYNAWANQRALDSVASLTVEQFTRPLGSSFASLRDTLAHIWGSQWVWLERFQGRSPAALPDVGQFPDLSTLRARWDDDEERLQKFVSSLTQEDLNRVVSYRTMKFGEYRNPLWQSMQHMVNHSTYHRGQVATLLRQLDAKPISTDLMHFYRERSRALSA
jgi:uncharacterized damage-inducible protein DinB